MPQYECNSFDPSCLNDRPVRIDYHHIELPSILHRSMVLGEIDSTVVNRGTVNVELLEHFAHHMRTNAHIPVRTALKVKTGNLAL